MNSMTMYHLQTNDYSCGNRGRYGRGYEGIIQTNKWLHHGYNPVKQGLILAEVAVYECLLVESPSDTKAKPQRGKEQE